MNHNITAVILYNSVSEYCGYQGASDVLQEFPIYSMTKTDDSQTVLGNIKNMTSDKKYFVNIVRSGSDSDQNPQQQGQGQGQNQGQNQNPLGPSPSTAVAMIILYSITGIITALFLVIIITGAIRAHRHPDRYGPRDVLGRPRQSRARGLGRAILDTLPIVKFGERDTPKPTDVELGSTAEARNVDHANADSAAQHDVPATETGGTEGTAAQQDIPTEQQSGIAPAQPLVAGTAAQDTSAADQGLGCSICTDDFEKGQDIRVLPCNHKFHPECVDPWLLNVSGTCPLCRVDLRPTTSRSSAEEDGEQDPNLLAPPLQPETDISHRRRSALRDILYFRSRPDASSEERISALRRLREQRRNHSGDVAGSANASEEDVAAARRSRRISVRLSDVFHSRTRRRGDDHEESQPPPPIFGSVDPSSSQNQHAEDSTPNPSEARETDSDSHRRS
ncbi:hypothetical protein K491DRAFT_62360 [Lophiostoma macrostomum CBS 122681]|uniref:RING-type domain-containing protein n=1 Tax=Lophiostoma macrostomum CBS 122681 TaxID=1314788 RepID=A0A6A6TM58_9PLEO|nr:hypothetical protein K491DRAFT_62360 [Lophiostoma macrostomum CBS 122681]